MRKIAFLLALGALLTACDSGYKKDGPDVVNSEKAAAAGSEKDSTTAANLSAVAQQPQIDTSASKIGTEHPGGAVAAGLKLIAASDCASCHKEREKVVGPAYVEVARKYPASEANIAMLAGKIVNGGSGHWGAVPMTPHVGLSVADAREMTKYILSLK